MSDLVEFLRARLSARWEAADSIHSLGCAEIRIDATCDCGEPGLARAEVEAKRRIMDSHQIVPTNDPKLLGFGCANCHDHNGTTMPYGYCTTILALALPYADHPGHDEAWRP